jgi:hypothetical protein
MGVWYRKSWLFKHSGGFGGIFDFRNVCRNCVARPIFQFDQAEGLVGSGANFSKAIKNKKKQPNQTPLPQGFGLKHTMGQRAVNHQRKGSIWLHIAENPHFFA